jgi:hypothetical protein
VFTIRGTRRLLHALKVKPTKAPPEPTTKLGNWYANLLPLESGDFLICVSEKTLLPVPLPISALSNLPVELSKALAPVLSALGVGPDLIGQERFAMGQCSFSTTASRQVVGFMNEFAFMMSVRLEEERRVSMTELSLWLAETPCKICFPDKATQELFAR